MIQIKIRGISLDLLSEVREFFRSYIDKEVIVEAHEDLIDLTISDSVPVILKYNYPDLSLDLGGLILSLKSDDFLNVVLK